MAVIEICGMPRQGASIHVRIPVPDAQAAALRATLGKLAGTEIQSVYVTDDAQTLRQQWRAAVTAGQTEEGFLAWAGKRHATPPR